MEQIITRLERIFNSIGMYTNGDDIETLFELDSMQFVNIMLKVEEDFDIELKEQDISVLIENGKQISIKKYADVIQKIK